MLRRFNLLSGSGEHARGPQFWLQAGAVALAVLNAVALYLYLDPPGGSRKELTQEAENIRGSIRADRTRVNRLRTVSSKVQVGNTQSADFESKNFLPKRLAYATVISELQRMVKNSGLQERDAVYTEEPIEGTTDLLLLNSTANYEGSYENLMKFLYQVDQSPMLLMLENVTAAPQQKGGQINTSIRFQAVIREDGTGAAGGLQ